METSSETITKLLKEHEAIRASFNWLEITVNSTLPQFEIKQGAELQLEKLRVVAKNLLELLNGLRFGIKEHIARDLIVLKPIAGIISLQEIGKEHREIEEELDCTVKQLEIANDEKWNVPEFIRYLSGVRNSIHLISALVDQHTRVEDEAIEMALAGRMQSFPSG